MTNNIFEQRHWVFLGLCAIYIAIFWPGFMSDDSQSIMREAITGSFGDHHPPLYAYLWMYLMKLYPGSGLMFTIQAALIWGAAYNISCAIGRKWPLYICFLLPIYPGFLAHSAFLWKDIHFTHGYIFVASLLIKQRSENSKLDIYQLASIITLLFYSTSVKYQARFLLPLMVLWVLGHQFGKFITLKTISITAILSTAGIIAVDKVNEIIVPAKQQSYSWQCVKIFDLAGMSVNTGELLVPKFLLRSPDTSLKDIEQHYDYLWEPLITMKSSPLQKTKSDAEREILLGIWKKQVITHPLAYLKHRFRLWIKIVQQNSLLSSVEKAIKGTAIPPSVKWLTYIFSYVVWIPVLLFYLLFGLNRNRKQHTLGTPLAMLSVVSLTLPAFLFVFSLAATPRYVYFSQVFLAFCHPLFLVMLLDWWHKKSINLLKP